MKSCSGTGSTLDEPGNTAGRSWSLDSLTGSYTLSKFFDSWTCRTAGTSWSNRRLVGRQWRLLPWVGTQWRCPPGADSHWRQRWVAGCRWLSKDWRHRWFAESRSPVHGWRRRDWTGNRLAGKRWTHRRTPGSGPGARSQSGRNWANRCHSDSQHLGKKLWQPEPRGQCSVLQ